MRPFLVVVLASAVAAACAASAPSASAPSSPVATLGPPPVASPEAGDGAPEPDGAVEADAATALPEAGDASPSVENAVDAGPACNEQTPQDFLVRSNFLKAGEEGMKRAIQYRTDTYGYFKGFGRAPADAPAPSSFVVSTTFMGLPVKMHRKVVPALKCVEEEITRACASHPYTAQALAGIRFRNTYRGGEVTNHIYGIAIDIDPGRNSCCGCVPPWNDVPACKRPSKTEYDRMAMPECWVHAFERYGFYWLGHDRLRDTMHFEFLGDPEKILKGGP